MRDQTCPTVRIPWLRQLWPAGAMAKNIKIRIGLIILILLLLAVFRGSFSDKDKSIMGSDESIPVLVASEYIPAFTIVKIKMAAVRHFPKEYVPPGSIHTIRELVGSEDHELYMAAVAIPAGQPLTQTVMDELGKSRGMASTLPQGKVAVSFAADPVRGAGGWVEPGDSIAVFHTMLSAHKEEALHKTSLLFPSLPVWAVDKNRLGAPHPDAPPGSLQENPESGPTVFTVVVNPLQAARLIEAREEGHLSVVLRSLGDDSSWVVHE